VAEKSQPRKPTRKIKKRWQQPKVKTGRLFESNSLACGKNAPGIADCDESNATQS
jgi:hypothetical protein